MRLKRVFHVAAVCTALLVVSLLLTPGEVGAGCVPANFGPPGQCRMDLWVPTGSGDWPCPRAGVPNGVMPPETYRLLDWQTEPWSVEWTMQFCCKNDEWPVLPTGWSPGWIDPGSPYSWAETWYTLPVGSQGSLGCDGDSYPMYQTFYAGEKDPFGPSADKNLGPPPCLTPSPRTPLRLHQQILSVPILLTSQPAINMKPSSTSPCQRPGCLFTSQDRTTASLLTMVPLALDGRTITIWQPR